jgi:hypothetical protein
MTVATKLERASLRVVGPRYELQLGSARITIRKDGGDGPPSNLTIPVGRIRATALERPSRGTPGWLHLTVVGGTPTPTSSLGATLDPYTVTITARDLPAARKLVRLVSQHIQARGLPPEPADGTIAASTSVIVTGAASRPATPPPPPPQPPGSPPNGQAAAPPIPSTSPPDSDDEEEAWLRSLRHLAELRDAGALSDDEFERAKVKLLRVD